jgi:hypothetical protein
LARIVSVLLILGFLLPFCPAPTSAQSSGPLPLSSFPRPAGDNGFGIHWSSYVYGQSTESVDYFVRELVAMGVHWVKFLNDGTEGRHNDYLVDRLVANGIMPVLRVYDKCNRALDLSSLRNMVTYYRAKGIYYFELYNEPELPDVAGGWCNGEKPDPERLLDIWLPAARVIQEAGGYSAIPSMFPPGTTDPDASKSFFMEFFRSLKSRGDTPILYRSFAAVHNYFINHPVEYPYDDANLSGRPLTPAEIAADQLTPAQVSSINQARAIARQPRAQGGYYLGKNVDEDPTAFLGYVAYHNRFREFFDFDIPLISTEGGVNVGSSEDPRYPRVTERLQSERTLQALAHMLDQAPDYYFAFNSWLLAEQALGRSGSLWESWAWYHDQISDHLPVVDRLKSWSRRNEVRLLTGGSGRRPGPTAPTSTPYPLSMPPPGKPSAPPTAALRPTATPTPAAKSSIDPNSAGLSRFPRPAGDNGWGIHWAPILFGQSTDMVDRFVAEARRMGIHWVKLMQADEAKVEHEYLIRQLVANDIMPVLRVYKTYNDPYEHLNEIVAIAKPLGVSYFELYNEPNISGFPGGWRNSEPISVAHMVAVWLPAARTVIANGGFPGVPALSPGGDAEDTAFLRQFLQQVRAAGGQEVLANSWIGLHNYFLNHPLSYPEDPVNLRSVPLTTDEIGERRLSDGEVASINLARANSRLPRSQGGYHVGDTIQQDSNGFRKFEAYNSIVQGELGRSLPIISTEGGALPTSREDPRYPTVTDDDVATLTVGAYTYMVNEAPDYYFAVTPWLIADLAAGGSDSQWESAAWFRASGGLEMPVVDAVRKLAGEGKTRKATSSNDTDQAPMSDLASQTPTPMASPSSHTPTPNAITGTPSSGDIETKSGWLIVWRDQEIYSCTQIHYSSRNPAVKAWQPPYDGRKWGLEFLSEAGKRLSTLGTIGGTKEAVPPSCLYTGWLATPTPQPMPAPSATPVQPTPVWDARLDILKVKILPAPDVARVPYWRVTEATYEAWQEAGGRHHVYVRLLDENGQDVDGAITVSWPDGQVEVKTEHKPPEDPYSKWSINFPMYGPAGSYNVAVSGVSETVKGVGMPGKEHVNYMITFQRTLRTQSAP